MAFNAFPVPTNSFTSYASALTGTLSWGCIHSAVGFTLNQNITPAHPESATSTGLYFVENISGSPTGNARYNYINVNSDNAAFSSLAQGAALGINHNFGGNAATGDRVAFSCQFSQFNASQNVKAGQSYSSAGLYAQATVNDNGTGLTAATASGQLQAINVIGTLATAATDWYQLSAAEFDVTMGTGCSAYEKIGIAVVQLGTDKVQGAVVDTAISLSNASGAVGWNLGIGLGRPDGIWPFVSGATIMGCEPSGTPGTVTYGIDLSAVTLASGGAGFLAPLTTPASSGATGKQGSIIWDANFIYICTATNTWKRVSLSTF